MPSKLGRNYLNLCFTKIKKPLSTQPSPISHTADHHRQALPFSSPAVASAATFITNYNSLYECTTSKPFHDGDPDAYFTATAVDFVTAFASHRFFFSSPGRSNSIVESTSTATASTTSLSSSSSNVASDDYSGGDGLFNNSFAIPTYSPDPYADFRRSMQEMVEAREKIEGTKSSWEFLHELLLCYLALNPKSTHKHIFRAFAVIKSSLPPPESAAGGCEISGQ